jgi:hypothetical protein
VQLINSDIPYLCIEVVDQWCIKYVSFEDYRSIMNRKYKILVCKCQLELIEINGSIQPSHIFNIENLFSVYFHVKFASFKIYFQKA